ncbi:MAG: putative glycoside hydrolase [Comamonadaceae bacterium]|nr:putative glycoside hydrolase [Comamonadaceae bacterium]
MAGLLSLALAAPGAQALDLRVRDAQSGAAVAGATAVVGNRVYRSDEQGLISVPEEAQAGPVAARAPGYARFKGVAAASPMVIALRPLRPKALYLSAYGIGSATLRGDALRLVADTELNALVIDIKGDRGIVPYPSPALAAAGLAQQVVTVRDMPALVQGLLSQGLYLIARIVTFKDAPYATLHPDWAVHDARGKVWQDREGLAWIDPFRRKAWAHSLALAEEAAALGFDEIQFDYLRFPDATGLSFAEPDTEERRIAAIAAFLDAAQQRLARYNVFIAADVFGYVTWNRDDTHIGQQLESIVRHVDYLSPMLYPSGFSFGIPGYRDPVDAPYEIVHRSLQRALERTGLPGIRLRPWLQAFRDYAFDRRSFGEREIRLQIEAAEALGTDGWMLWNAGNRYQQGGLDRDDAP